MTNSCIANTLTVRWYNGKGHRTGLPSIGTFDTPFPVAAQGEASGQGQTSNLAQTYFTAYPQCPDQPLPSRRAFVLSLS